MIMIVEVMRMRMTTMMTMPMPMPMPMGYICVLKFSQAFPRMMDFDSKSHRFSQFKVARGTYPVLHLKTLMRAVCNPFPI